MSIEHVRGTNPLVVIVAFVAVTAAVVAFGVSRSTANKGLSDREPEKPLQAFLAHP
jgi:hypothetical protein